MNDWYWVSLGCLISLVLLVIAHYLPRIKEVEINEDGQMIIGVRELLFRYVVGVGALAIGFSAIQVGQQDYEQILELAIVGLVGGLSVILWYAWDHFIKWIRKLRKYEAVSDGSTD